MAESPTMEVRARLTADTASFMSGMKQASQAAEQFQGSASKLTAGLTAMGVAAGAIGTALIALGVKSFNAAARVEELDVALRTVSAANGILYSEASKAAQGIKDQGIEMEVAQRATLRFIQNNLNLADASKIARNAQDLAVLSAKNSTEEFDLLVSAIVTQRTELLKSAGIQGTAGQAFQKMAATLGKSTQALTAQEKQQAIVNMVMQEGTKVAGTYEMAMTTPSKVLRSFARLNTNLQVAMGQSLLKAFGPMIFAVYELYKKFVKAVEGTGAFHDMITVLTKVFLKLVSPVTTFVDGLGKMIDKIDAGKINIEGISKAFEFMLPAIAAVGAGLATFAGAQLTSAVPILGRFLAFLSPVGVAFAVLAMTSVKVRSAIANLLGALSPFLGVIKNVAAAIGNLGGYAVGFLAKAINGLAALIRTITSFFVQHTAVAKALGVVILAVAAGFLAYKAAIILIPIIQSAMAFTSALVEVAMVLMSGAQLASIASTNGLAASMLVLDASLGGIPILVGAIVAGVVALVAGFVYAWNNSEQFRAVITNAFNSVAKVVGKVISFVLKVIGYTLIAFGNLIDVNNWFGKTIAAVFQFVWGTVLTVFIGIVKLVKFVIDAFISLMENQGILGQVIESVINFVIKAYILYVKTVLTAVKNVLDAFVNLMESHETVRKIVETVFNVIMRVVAYAVTSVIVSLANIIKGIATVIHFFETFLGAAKDIVGGIIYAFFWLGKSILGGLGKVAGNIADFLKESLATVKGWVTNFLGLMMKIPGVSALVNLAFSGMSTATNFASDALDKLGGVISNVFTGTSDPAQKSVDAITGVSQSLIDSSKSWGNYSSGVSGALSTIANKMLGFSQTVTDFAAKDNGALIVENLIKGAKASSLVLADVIFKLKDAEQINFGKAVVDTLVAGAKMASAGLGDIINKMEEMKDIKVGEFIVDKTSEAAIKAGEFLVGLAGNIEKFTSGDALGSITGAIGDFFSSMKEGLGFGNILETAKKELALNTNAGLDNQVAQNIQNQADRMKAIRDAMASGIDSIKQVLTDLQQAAKDFADSLKDTIVGFAGLKGVELPDGFVPQAKSLIENMRMRLDKSQQFATQIAQLQAMNLDAGALKQIIEEGPIKGAQLAASILSGGQQAVNDVSALQRAIEFTGAAIGQYGSEAAFSGKIANAQADYASIANAMLGVQSKGNTVSIDQGAFVVNVDISKATNTDEQIKMITDAIQGQFQLLAKELAAK
jgi:phage-related protein